jgi:hypothetical protein
MNEDSITSIYCDVDDFCKAHSLPGDEKRAWFPESRLSLSEVMTIILLFHLSGYRCFKWYYPRYVCLHLISFFPAQVSYNRFVN